MPFRLTRCGMAFLHSVFRASGVLLLVIGVSFSVLQAKTITLKPTDDWFSVLNGDGLKPGDMVVLRAGTYSDRRMLTLKHRGTEGKPIVIGARAGERVLFKRPDAKQNSFNLVGVQHLKLMNFEITGGSSGIRISADGDTQPKYVTLEGLHIHHIGGVAVTCNHKGSIYEGMVFVGNHIHHTGGHGEAFYLGCNNEKDGSTPGYIFKSVIAHNYIHDLNGPNISQGDGIEIKDGSYGNFIHDNVIHDTKYPGITVYGTDGKLPNRIERNIIWNTGDHGIQAAAEAIIAKNIVYDAGGDAIHVRSHQSADPRDMIIRNNTLIQRKGGKTGLRIQKPAKGFGGMITVINNAIYAPIALRTPADTSLWVLRNAGSGNSEDKALGKGRWNPGGDLAKDLDQHFYPTANSFLIGKGMAMGPEDIIEPTDFLGRPIPTKNETDAGAYQYVKGKQGWPITKGFKHPKPQAHP